MADRSRAHFGLKHAMRERARGSYVSQGHRKRTTGAQCREDKEPKRIRLLQGAAAQLRAHVRNRTMSRPMGMVIGKGRKSIPRLAAFASRFRVHMLVREVCYECAIHTGAPGNAPHTAHAGALLGSRLAQSAVACRDWHGTLTGPGSSESPSSDLTSRVPSIGCVPCSTSVVVLTRRARRS